MSDPSTAIGGLGSIASAVGGMGGGGGGGGMVVGGPAPWAAMKAGDMQAAAAFEANNQAQEGVRTAIASINENYGKARYAVQPYRTEGVQALNQLNQYLGLDPYNPGTAPKTKDQLINDITHSQVLQYIYGNSDPTADDKGNRIYRGVGSGPGGMTPAQWQGASATDKLAVGNAALEQQIKEEIAKPQFEANAQDQAEWQQNMDMYNKYKDLGPMTQAQITENVANQPGYQAELQQGTDAIAKQAGAKGYLGSGRVLKELSSFGQNTLSKYYTSTLDRLQNLATNGQNAATNTAANYTGQGGANSGLQMAGGESAANSLLAQGNAKANALLAANQEYKVIGGGGGGK